MLHILMTAVNAVVPIVLLIGLGYLLRSKGFVSVAFVKTGNALVFKILLPVMLFINVYEIGNLSDVDWPAVLYCVAAVTVLFLLGPAVAAISTQDLRRKGVIWQCVFRSNFTIIGISMSASLGGTEAAAFSSIVATLVVPLFNIFAVIALSVYNRGETGEKPDFRKIIVEILKNPLILATVVGIGCLGVRAWQQNTFGAVAFSLKEDLKFLYSPLSSLKAMATPLALIVLGGQFQFSVVKGLVREIAWATSFRLVFAPVLCIGGALLLDRFAGTCVCTGSAVPGMLCLFGSPVAVSSAIMASQMGGDDQLAAQLVVWTSIGSMFTVFALVCCLMGMGILSV